MNDAVSITMNQSDLINLMSTFFSHYLMNYMIYPLWAISCAMAFILGYSSGSK